MTNVFFILMLTFSSSIAEIEVSESQIQRLDIKVAQPEPLEGLFSAPWPGLAQVMPADEFRITLPLDVMVQQLLVKEGEYVEKGQVLLETESRELRIWANELLTAFDNLKQCESVLEKIQQRLNLGLATQNELSRQEKECAKASHILDSAKGSLTHAGWNESKIEDFLLKREIDDRLLIDAPVSGILYRLPVMAGNHIEAGAELVTIWPMDRIKLRLNVPPSKARHLKPGQVCLLADNREATIHSISNVVSLDNRVTVLLSCSDLTPGERVQVSLPASSDTTWLLPTKAVVRFDRKDWVFKRTENGFLPVEVFRGSAKKRMVQVSGEIQAPDMFAIQGTAALKGMWLGLGGE